MKRPYFLTALLVLLLGAGWFSSQHTTNASVSGMVISAVYGGGGTSGSPTFNRDYIELFNAGSTPISIAGWSVQYSSSGTANWLKFDLLTDAPSLSAGQYYLIIVGTAGAAGASLPITPDADAGSAFEISASNGSVALVSNTDTLTPGTSDPDIVDLVGFGTGTIESEGTAAPALNNTTAALRLATGCTDTNINAADFSLVSPAPIPRTRATPLNPCGGGGSTPNPTPSPQPTHTMTCGSPAYHIGELQEGGAYYGLGGQRTIEGIVTGSFQPAPPSGLGGFYLQDPMGDGNPDTSDAIWVAVPSSEFTAAPGERLRLRGIPAEVDTQTTLTAISDGIRCGTGSITPTAVTLPLPFADRERYEGMVLTVSNSIPTNLLFVSDATDLGATGSILLSDRRIAAPTMLTAPGPNALSLAAQHTTASIVLDDGRNGQPLPNTIPYVEADASIPFRAGSTHNTITAILAQSADTYRLHFLVPPDWTLSPRPATPPDTGGRVKIALFSLGGFFNGDGSGSGFPTAGALTLSEYQRQRTKLAAALDNLTTDIVGLTGLENDAGAAQAVQDLATAGVRTWAVINTGVIGSSQTRVGLIYNPATVAPVGAHAILEGIAPFQGAGSAVLAQTFRHLATGKTATIVVTDWMPRTACPPSGPDSNQNDGQACGNATRTQAANTLTAWMNNALPSYPFSVADPHRIVLIGQFNTYTHETPFAALGAEGFHNLAAELIGPTAYNHIGPEGAGTLDNILVNAALRPAVTGMGIWHINADEPAARDYRISANQPEMYRPDAYRSSPYDPVILGLNFPGATGILSANTPITEGSLIHIALTDADLTDTSITVTVTTPAGDIEHVTLAPDGTGQYRGTLSTSADAGAPIPYNTHLETNASAGAPDNATITYIDETNAEGLQVTITTTVQILSGGATGSITTPSTIIPGQDDLLLTITDADLSAAGQINITVTSSNGESETLTITGSGGVFSRVINTHIGPATPDNGRIEASDRDTITFSYLDPKDANEQPITLTANTAVIATNTPGTFRLIQPAGAIVVTPASVSVVWQAAPNHNAYLLNVWQMAAQTPVLVQQIGIDHRDACSATRCTHTLNLSASGSGEYRWTVIADGIGSADRPASNGPLAFSLNAQGAEWVRNGGFERAGSTAALPAQWRAFELSGDRRACKALGNGSRCALLFVGSQPERARFRQTLNVAGYLISGGEPLTLSADIFATKPNPRNVITLTITYTNPTAGQDNNGKDILRITPVDTQTGVYLRHQINGSLAGPIKSAVLVVRYRLTSGRLRVDNVSVRVGGP